MKPRRIFVMMEVETDLPLRSPTMTYALAGAIADRYSGLHVWRVKQIQTNVVRSAARKKSRRKA